MAYRFFEIDQGVALPLSLSGTCGTLPVHKLVGSGWTAEPLSTPPGEISKTWLQFSDNLFSRKTNQQAESWESRFKECWSPRLTSATTANYTAVSVAGEGNNISEGPEGPSAQWSNCARFRVTPLLLCLFLKCLSDIETRGHHSHWRSTLKFVQIIFVWRLSMSIIILLVRM